MPTEEENNTGNGTKEAYKCMNLTCLCNKLVDQETSDTHRWDYLSLPILINSFTRSESSVWIPSASERQKQRSDEKLKSN